MPRRLIPSNRIGLLALAAGLVCETVAVLAVFVLGTTWTGGVEAIVLHVGASLLSGIGAASFLTNRECRHFLPAPAPLFILLVFAIPIAGLLAVLLLTGFLASHRFQDTPHRPALECIPEPGPDTSCPITQPLVTMLDDLDPASLRACVLGMEDMPPGQTRTLLTRLLKHPDIRVRHYAAGLINDQTDADERRLAVLEEHGRSHPRDLPTLLAIVESHLRLIDERLVPPDELPQAAQRAIHAAEAVLAVAPRHAVALQAMARFQLVLDDFHGAYGTILRLYRFTDHRQGTTDLLARLSYEYAARQPVGATPPPSPPQPKVPSWFS
jgi:hypothetical protein